MVKSRRSTVIFRRAVTGSLAALTVCAAPLQAPAQAKVQLCPGREAEWAENSILFYECCTSDYDTEFNLTLGTGEYTMTGDNTAYDGSQVFSAAELALIEANRPFYEAAAAKYNIPWQLIAAIHSQEHGLSRDNPSNGQGAYQLYSYTNGGTNANRFTPGPTTDAEFARQTDIAASVIAQKAAGLDLSTDRGIQTTLFRYNGTASAYVSQALDLGFSKEEANAGAGSPYVMNRADALRDPGQNKSTWGQIKTDGGSMSYPANNGFGAFVKFQALGGEASNTPSYSNPYSPSYGETNYCKSDNITDPLIDALVTEGGLTVEQAIAFVQRYGLNANGEIAAIVGGAQWAIGRNGVGGANCVTFSAFFLNAFTGSHYQGGDGGGLIYRLSNGTIDSTPGAFSVFSTGDRTYSGGISHTGVVIGLGNGQYLVAQSDYGRRKAGAGDGTHAGSGTAYFRIETGDPRNWVSTYGAGANIQFFHPDYVDYDAISSFISGGSF